MLTVLCLLSRAGCQRGAGPEKLPEPGDQVWGTSTGCLRLGGVGGAGSVTGEVDRHSVELTDFRVSLIRGRDRKWLKSQASNSQARTLSSRTKVESLSR